MRGDFKVDTLQEIIDSCLSNRKEKDIYCGDGIWDISDVKEYLVLDGDSHDEYPNDKQLEKIHKQLLKTEKDYAERERYYNYYKEKNSERVKVEEFLKKYPDAAIGSAYETNTTILLSSHPDELGPKIDSKDGYFPDGSGFNYGSTTILDFTKLKKQPTKIMILAQND